MTLGSFGVLTCSGVLGGIFFFFCFLATSSPLGAHYRLQAAHLTAAAVFRRASVSATPEVAAMTAVTVDSAAAAAAAAAVVAAVTAAAPVLTGHQEVGSLAVVTCHHR